MENKVLLVTFQTNTDVIGLKYIHSYLHENQIDSHILFIPQEHKKDIHAIEIFLQKFKPKIIGISLMSEEFYQARDFTQLIKEEFPDIIIVWGGLHPSINPKECLNYADYVFVDESEESFSEFVIAVFKNSPVVNIPNLAYKTANTIQINKIRSLKEDLDYLPFPEHYPLKSFILDKGKIIKLNDFLFRKYSRYSGKFYSLTTTRGCPFSCAYCCNSFFNKIHGVPKIRKRSAENVIKELELALHYFPDLIYINIQDDNFFTYSLQWMEEFAEMYKKRINKKFICRSTPAHLTKEKLYTLKKAGLSWVFMGLQSGSPRVNKEVYERFVSNEQFIKTTKIIRDSNLAGQYDVITDNPYESEEDTLKTIDVLLSIPKPYTLQLLSLCFYPGTKLYDRALKENLKIEDPLEKEYLKWKPTFLNKILKLCPLLPNRFIRLMVKKRNTNWAPMVVNLILFPTVLIVEPLVWAKLSLISFDYNLFSTANMIFKFYKTGFNKIILRK